jgi:hypothetical protein
MPHQIGCVLLCVGIQHNANDDLYNLNWHNFIRFLEVNRRKAMQDFEMFDDNELFSEESAELDLFSEELEDRVNACISSLSSGSTGGSTSTLSCLTTACTVLPSSGCPSIGG